MAALAGSAGVYGLCLALEGEFGIWLTALLGPGMVIGFGLGWPVGRVLMAAARDPGPGEGAGPLERRTKALMVHGILWYGVSGAFLTLAIWFGSSSWYRYAGPVNGQAVALYGLLTAAYIGGTLGDLWFLRRKYPGKLPVAQRIFGAALALAQGIWCFWVFAQALLGLAAPA